MTRDESGGWAHPEGGSGAACDITASRGPVCESAAW